MEKTMQQLINPQRFYESLRANDFSFVNGLGEIVDNSVEARAKHVNVMLNVGEDAAKKKRILNSVAVIDDGIGMNYTVLSKCLVLGDSIREHPTGKSGIGKFGVGLVTGSISIGRKVEVYSRTGGQDAFLYTYIDLDDIKEGDMKGVPVPVEKDIPDEYKEYLKDSSGTVVILSNCDRMDGTGDKTDIQEMIASVATFLGRTYRKFISAGTEIYLNNNKVYLHDPLYLDGPTIFDIKEHQDPRAQKISQKTIEYPIPGGNGETAPIKITITLLPKEWRMYPGDGGKSEAKKRKIDQNEGISILRADREVLYEKVPYLIGKKGQASYENSDRFWGCEISFPPELDQCFQVRYIKRGAEPIGALKDKIRDEISSTIKVLRKTIKSDWEENVAEANKSSGTYDNAEQTMANITKFLPVSKKGKDLTEEDIDNKLNEIVEDIFIEKGESDASEEERTEKKEELRKKPYSIELVKMPLPTFFEPVVLMDNIIIKINVNHPFYSYVIKPLCGDLTDDEENAKKINERTKIKDAIMLLLLSYAKAEAQFQDNEDLFINLRSQWALTLSTAVKGLYEGRN